MLLLYVHINKHYKHCTTKISCMITRFSMSLAPVKFVYIFSLEFNDRKISQIIRQFYPDLLRWLPIDDATFRAELKSTGLLPGTLKSQILSKPTKEEKAEHFLDHGINNDINNFLKLISVMGKYDSKRVQELAMDISGVIDGELYLKGMYIVYLSTYVIMYMHVDIMYLPSRSGMYLQQYKSRYRCVACVGLVLPNLYCPIIII